MPSLHRSGYTLPVEATFGFMESAVGVLGFSGAVPALLRFMLQDAYPDGSITDLSPEAIGLLNPLYPYYSKEYGVPQAVDYVFFQAFRRKLDIMYAVRGGRGLARHIGRVWWSGERPIDQSRSHTHTLSYHLSASILAALSGDRRTGPATRDSSLHDQLSTYASHRLWVACRSFAEALTNYNGMVCHSETTPTGAAISFVYCPFCANQLHSCGMMLGVIEAFLVWLYEKPDRTLQERGGCKEDITITFMQEDTHHIQIAVRALPPNIAFQATG